MNRGRAGGGTIRRPSRRHSLLVAAIRLLGLHRRTAAQVGKSVAKRDARWTPPRPPSWTLRGVRATCSDEVGWPVWTLAPEREADATGHAVVAVHGGGYTSELILPHWTFYAGLVRKAGVEVVVPIYPLAPHGTAATVVPVVAGLIAAEVRRRGADRVAVEGDSAGAGLLLAAMQMLVAGGEQVPGSMVLISPWLDATLGDPRSRSIDDPLLSIEGLREAGRLWAGDPGPANPLASPINGSLAGLPPTLVLAGSLDILYPDALRLRDLAEAAGATFTFDLRDGLLHGWAGFAFLPEARQVAPDILRRLSPKE